MASNYYRLCLRFKDPDLVGRLRSLQRELENELGKKKSMSQVVEKIVAQYLDTNHPSIEER